MAFWTFVDESEPANEFLSTLRRKLAPCPGVEYHLPTPMLCRFALVVMVSFVLAGCVSTPQGRKFDPWQGAVNTDRKIGEWIDQQSQ